MIHPVESHDFAKQQMEGGGYDVGLKHARYDQDFIAQGNYTPSNYGGRVPAYTS